MRVLCFRNIYKQYFLLKFGKRSKMKVSKIMNKAIAAEDDVSLRDAAKIMSSKNIGSLIIMNKEKIVGIITERDIMRNVSKLDIKVSLAMSKNVITIDANESLDNAALLMNKHKIKRLPVIKKGVLVGIITVTDILGHAEEWGENFFFE